MKMLFRILASVLLCAAVFGVLPALAVCGHDVYYNDALELMSCKICGAVMSSEDLSVTKTDDCEFTVLSSTDLTGTRAEVLCNNQTTEHGLTKIGEGLYSLTLDYPIDGANAYKISVASGMSVNWSGAGVNLLPVAYNGKTAPVLVYPAYNGLEIVDRPENDVFFSLAQNISLDLNITNLTEGTLRIPVKYLRRLAESNGNPYVTFTNRIGSVSLNAEAIEKILARADESDRTVTLNLYKADTPATKLKQAYAHKNRLVRIYSPATGDPHPSMKQEKTVTEEILPDGMGNLEFTETDITISVGEEYTPVVIDTRTGKPVSVYINTGYSSIVDFTEDGKLVGLKAGKIQLNAKHKSGEMSRAPLTVEVVENLDGFDEVIVLDAICSYVTVDPDGGKEAKILDGIPLSLFPGSIPENLPAGRDLICTVSRKTDRVEWQEISSLESIAVSRPAFEDSFIILREVEQKPIETETPLPETTAEQTIPYTPAETSPTEATMQSETEPIPEQPDSLIDTNRIIITIICVSAVLVAFIAGIKLLTKNHD